MVITLSKIKIGELIKGYEDSEDTGVKGYEGQLDIRPQYQREFIYDAKRRSAVMDTIIKGYPIGIMYWAVKHNGAYEIIDGQQRTLSICKYVNNEYSIYDGIRFYNLPEDQQKSILEYELTIYICSGDESEKLEWFKTINIAGLELTDQELRNAVYSGSFITDAKKYFSKPGCAAYKIASDYVRGTPIRQDYLETALDWISDGEIDNYLSIHQNDNNASVLWRYFQDVITWVESTFPRKFNAGRYHLMRGINWGKLYHEYKDVVYNTDELNEKVRTLMLDDEVTNKRGIYSYVLTNDPKYLSLRQFTEAMKIEAYERQNGRCAICGNEFNLYDMEADHIIPWSQGGKTTPDNCQMLCKKCNREKSDK